MVLSDTRLGLILVFPLIALVLLVSLYPMGYSLWLSFVDVNFLTHKTSFVGLANYAETLQDPFLRNSIFVSFRFVVETTVLVTLLGLGIALVINEKFRGVSFVKTVVILPWALSEFATGLVGRFILDSSYGLLNAILLRIGVINQSLLFLNGANSVEWISLFYSWNLAPIGVFFILAALQTAPELLYKQAKVDGASIIARFRLVTFPFIRYAVLIVIVLSTIQAGGAVVIFYALTGGGPGTTSTPVPLYDFRVFLGSFNYGYGSAISWLALIFIVTAVTGYFYILTRRK